MEETTTPKLERANDAAGFTLIEIMAVVMIIGLLSSLVGYAVFQQVDKGRVVACGDVAAVEKETGSDSLAEAFRRLTGHRVEEVAA